MRRNQASARNKKRDYDAEYQDFHGKPEQIKRRAQRNAARSKMVSTGKASKGDGRDVDHISRNTANNKSSNLRMTSQKANRSWRKGKKG